jgi:hypothetical protein
MLEHTIYPQTYPYQNDSRLNGCIHNASYIQKECRQNEHKQDDLRLNECVQNDCRQKAYG